MKSSRTHSLLIVISALAAMAGVVEARTWTQAATGKKIEADFVRLDGQTVVLNVGGRPAQVPLAALSPEDQAFVKEAAAGKAGGAGGGTSAGDWPQFRGAKGDGISPDTGLLKEWPQEGPKKLWVFDGAGMGYSSFSITGGKLYTLGTRDADSYAVCVDIATGKEVWATKFGGDDKQGYSANWGHGPRSTPTFSDGMIYALDPKGNLAAIDAEKGEVKWSKNLNTDFGGKSGGWGYSESPLVDGDKLIVAPGGQTAGIVALNKKTGETIWTATDVKPGNAEYASIVPAELNGKRQYVKLFQNQVVSVDAADGKQLWKSDWPGKTAVIPTPIVSGNEVYVTSGYGVGCKLIKISAENSASDAWEINSEMKNHHGGVVKVGDHIYGFSDGPGLICQEWATGKVVWNQKDPTLTKGAVHVADGKLICLNEGDGVVTLVDASPEGFKKHGEFKLDPQSSNRSPQGRIWTHPVVVGGRLYLRDQEYIVCYDLKG